MGIDTEFRRTLAVRYPESWGEGPIIQGQGLLVVDLLTTMFGAIGPTYDYQFSGDELVQFVFSHAAQGFQTSQIRTCVVTADLQARVPKQKAAEQSKRSSNRTHEPYPDACRFSSEGIILPSGTQSMRFDIRRVVCNRYLREVLWVFVINQLKQRACVPPSGCVFIFDHMSEGAVCFDSNGWWLDRTPGNIWGEADLKIPYWLRRFSSSTNKANDELKERIDVVVVQSTDSDLLPILLHFVSTMGSEFQARIVLRYWKKFWVDVNALYAQLSADGWCVADILMVLILGGTDFVDKASVLYGFSATYLLQTLSRFPKQHALGNATAGIKHFVRILRFLYSQKLGLMSPDASSIPTLEEIWSRCRPHKKAMVAASAGTSSRSSIAMPSVVPIRESFEAVCFNMRYWMVDWTKVDQRLQEPIRVA